MLENTTWQAPTPNRWDGIVHGGSSLSDEPTSGRNPTLLEYARRIESSGLPISDEPTSGRNFPPLGNPLFADDVFDRPICPWAPPLPPPPEPIPAAPYNFGLQPGVNAWDLHPLDNPLSRGRC